MSEEEEIEVLVHPRLIITTPPPDSILESRIITAEQQQQELYNYLGYNNEIIWDCFEESEKQALHRKIELTIPNEDEDIKIKEQIKDIVRAIWKQKKYNGGSLLMSPVFVLCVEYNEHSHDYPSAVKSTKYTLHPVFRIRKCVKKNDSHNCCMVFVDEAARVYATWQEYICFNTLSKSILIAPKKGIYNADADGQVILEVYDTPTCHTGAKIIRRIDLGATVGSLASSSLIIAGILSAPIASPLLVGATAIGIGCCAYGLIRSGYALFDRGYHQQTLSLKNADARSNWIGVVGSVFGIFAGGLTKGLSHISKNGRPLGTVLKTAVNISNAMSMVVGGAGLINGFFGMFLKFRDDEDISKLDVIQLGASLFLMTHSIYNFQTAKSIIKSNQERTIKSFRKDLGEIQRKQFDKMAKYKIETKGEEAGRTDIIRSLKNIPDRKDFFTDVYKINKSHLKSTAKVAASPEAPVSLGDGDKVQPIPIRLQKPKRQISELLEDVPENPALVIDDEINYTDVFHLSVKTMAILFRILKAKYTVINEDDLRSNIVNFQENLSEKSFKVFMEIMEKFVQQFGEIIQDISNRLIPFETFLADGFKVLYSVAGENMSDFIEYILVDDKDRAFMYLKQYYYKMRPLTVTIRCRICYGEHY